MPTSKSLLRHPQASGMRTRPDATQPAHTNVPNLNRVTGPQTYVMDDKVFSAEPFWNMCAADVKRDILCVKSKDEIAEVEVAGVGVAEPSGKLPRTIALSDCVVLKGS